MPKKYPSVTSLLAETFNTSVLRLRRERPRPEIDPGSVLRDEILPALKNGRLSVFLGAGVSYASGFPTWAQLIDRLAATLLTPELQAAFRLLSQHGSPLIMARFLRSQMGSDVLFAHRIHTALYGPEVDYARENHTLAFVVQLIAAAAETGAPLSLFTYNFDDLVEATLLSKHPSIAFDTLLDECMAHRSRAAVRIHHVHGYLPRTPDGDPEEWPEPVLAEHGFNALMSDASAWPNQVQAKALAYDDCLFVGVSMADPNLRRLLDLVQQMELESPPRRFVLATSYAAGSVLAPGAPPMDGETASHLNRIEEDLAASLGATRIPLPSHAYFEELVRTLCD